jgi:cobalamin biosynthesis Co2+ chelatase CbiK
LKGVGEGEMGGAFKGRVFKISKIVEKILKCFTWFGCFRIFKSAEMVKKLPNTKSLPLKAPNPSPQAGRGGVAGVGFCENCG